MTGGYKKYKLLNSKTKEDKVEIEKFCDLFALFVIAEKNEFYKNAPKNLIHEEGIKGLYKILKKYKEKVKS